MLGELSWELGTFHLSILTTPCVPQGVLGKSGEHKGEHRVLAQIVLFPRRTPGPCFGGMYTQPTQSLPNHPGTSTETNILLNSVDARWAKTQLLAFNTNHNRNSENFHNLW